MSVRGGEMSYGPDHDADLIELENIVAGDRRVSATAYVALIRRLGRRDPQVIVDRDTELYSLGLQQAFADEDLEGFVQVAEAAAQVLDAAGQHDRALARLEQALSMIPDGSPSAARLTSTWAALATFGGRARDARRTLEREGYFQGFDDRFEIAASLAGTRCLLLDDDGTQSSQAALAWARAEGSERYASFLMVQLSCNAAARGDLVCAEATASQLLSHAGLVGHPARQIDAEVALAALHARRSAAAPPDGTNREAERLFNNHALWRSLVSALWQAATRSDTDSERCYSELVLHHDWMNPGYRESFEGFHAYLLALAGPATTQDLRPPDQPTLLSLPNILASAEAVARGGTLRAAADWLVWLEGELPAEVVTSLEWPSCRYRVEALLRLRVGQPDEAEAGLERSIGVCEERGDTIEAEIGRAQLAELRGDEAGATLAASRLRDVGIEASLFASAAARIALRAARAGARLSIREAQVVGRVASGMSHKEIEAELGLPRRGASRAISSGYAKLGVKGRSHVAQVARERLIA